MKLKSIFFTILITTLLSCSKTSKERQMAQFKGLWKMHSHEIQDDNGNWDIHNWMNGGVGYVIYDGDGHMAVHITPKDYDKKKVNWKNELDSLESKKFRQEFELFGKNANTLANYVYVSNCKILDGNIIEHQRVSHGNPERFNEIAQRKFEFKGDTLILSPLELEAQKQRRIKWIKQ